MRIQYPGAVYHVMARASHGAASFADDTEPPARSALRRAKPACAQCATARQARLRTVGYGAPSRRAFLGAAGEACARTGWWIHAHVLMGHHYHLLLQTPE